MFRKAPRAAAACCELAIAAAGASPPWGGDGSDPLPPPAPPTGEDWAPALDPEGVRTEGAPGSAEGVLEVVPGVAGARTWSGCTVTDGVDPAGVFTAGAEAGGGDTGGGFTCGAEIDGGLTGGTVTVGAGSGADGVGAGTVTCGVEIGGTVICGVEPIGVLIDGTDTCGVDSGGRLSPGPAAPAPTDCASALDPSALRATVLAMPSTTVATTSRLPLKPPAVCFIFASRPGDAELSERLLYPNQRVQTPAWSFFPLPRTPM